MKCLVLLLMLFSIACADQSSENTESQKINGVTSQGDSTRNEGDLPSLILRPGEQRQMPAQRYEYQNVIIPQGAILNITEGSSALLHFVVRDSFIFQGTINARNFSTQEFEEYINVPGQNQIMVQFRNTNKGGDGGAGGLGGTNVGGSGALGTSGYGGGGGSGGGRLSQAARPYITNFTGRDARGQAGAGPPGYCGAAGGRGASRSDYGNGGIVYFETYGYFDGGGGVINLTGTQGENGANGGRGFHTNMTHGCYTGGGGGGGGAPGGHGGFFIGYYALPPIAYPRALVSGGRGGRGGQAPGEDRPRGTPGSNGQAGVSGKVFNYVKQ